MSILIVSGTPVSFFFFNDTATTEIYTLSLHDALPISPDILLGASEPARRLRALADPSRLEPQRSEEHTSELQSPCNLVCRLLLEKKKKTSKPSQNTSQNTEAIRDQKLTYITAPMSSSR